MRFPQPIDPTLHGITDYAVGSFLATAFPRVAGIEGTPAAMQIRIAGAVHADYSLLTRYPLGVVKLIPYKVHLALDAVGAVALAATPFVSGQWKKKRSQWLPHVAIAAFELTSLAFSDPRGKGDFHGDVESVRRANLEDPSAKIRGGGPAVRPASAKAVA